MTNDITKQWNEISKAAIESMKELGSINTRVIEKLTEQQLAVLNTCMEASQKEIEMAASGKNAQDPQALLKAQADLIAEYNGRLMSIVQSTGDILKDYTELEFPGGHIGIYVSGKAQAMIPPAVGQWLDERS